MGATFDTSGRVRRGVITPRGTFSFRPGFVRWTDLSPFTQGYVEAVVEELVRRLHNGGCKFGVRAFPDGKLRAPGFSDLAPETLARIMEDCAQFVASRTALDAKLGPAQRCDWSTSAWGKWLWETRVRGIVSDFPPLTPYLGDDGKVYLKPHPPGGNSHEG